MGPRAGLDKVNETKIRIPARNPISISRSSLPLLSYVLRELSKL
jgi:hypothetical protein